MVFYMELIEFLEKKYFCVIQIRLGALNYCVTRSAVAHLGSIWQEGFSQTSFFNCWSNLCCRKIRMNREVKNFKNYLIVPQFRYTWLTFSIYSYQYNFYTNICSMHIWSLFFCFLTNSTSYIPFFTLCQLAVYKTSESGSLMGQWIFSIPHWGHVSNPSNCLRDTSECLTATVKFPSCMWYYINFAHFWQYGKILSL